MANLSQEKRQRLRAFLETIREEHKDDDEVLIALGEIESELRGVATQHNYVKRAVLQVCNIVEFADVDELVPVSVGSFVQTIQDKRNC